MPAGIRPDSPVLSPTKPSQETMIRRSIRQVIPQASPVSPGHIRWSSQRSPWHLHTSWLFKCCDGHVYLFVSMYKKKAGIVVAPLRLLNHLLRYVSERAPVHTNASPIKLKFTHGRQRITWARTFERTVNLDLIFYPRTSVVREVSGGAVSVERKYLETPTVELCTEVYPASAGTIVTRQRV